MDSDPIFLDATVAQVDARLATNRKKAAAA